MKSLLEQYMYNLNQNELSAATRKKYFRDIMRFLQFVSDKETISKSDLIDYKSYLLSNYKPTSINSYLISINRYFCWLERSDLVLKTIKIQRKNSLENILTREEYNQLLEVCQKKGDEKSYLLMRTIACTGIRISELKHITLESVKQGVTVIYSKGKCRNVFVPSDLSKRLIVYCEYQNISTGVIFYGKKKNCALHPSGVWKLLKRISVEANVEAKKVYPHSLRHLFAKTYMEKVGNVFELADLLGHSSVETTRIYTMTSNLEKQKSLNLLEL